MLSPGTCLGPYEIVAPLGAGGMGEVYRARDTKLDRDVAVKILPELLAVDPDRLARFEREAKSVAQLSHPNILNIFDFGRDGQTTYAVMELLDGETLRGRLARGPLAPRRAVAYAVQIAHGLAAAHAKGLVHRDLKPENLFLTRDDRVKILDFGLAKPVEIGSGDATSLAVATEAGMVLGTVGYMAPEQVRAQMVDHRADVFALGAVLYEMLSGRRAFGGQSAADTLSASLNSEPPDPERPLAAGLERIIRRCLEKRPELRFQSTQDLAFALESSPGAVARAGTERGLGARRRWLPWMVAAAALAAAAAAWLTAPRPPFGPGTAEIRLSMLPPPGHRFADDAADPDPEYAISPDGRQIAFAALDDGGVPSLWVRALDSTTPRLLAGTTGAWRPFWSPDGRHVGFLTGSGFSRIANAGGILQSTSTGRVIPAVNGSASWGVTGRILFETIPPESQALSKVLYVIPDTGGPAVPALRAAARAGEQAQRFPIFLPDGRRFLYLSWTAAAADRAVMLGDLQDGSATPLVRTGFRAELAAPDVLVYVRDQTLVAQRFSTAPAALQGEPRMIVDTLTREAIPGNAAFTASRAGVVAFRTRSRGLASELRWIARLGEVEPPVLTASDITVSLSPDGRRAAMTRVLATPAAEERFPSNLWFVDLMRGVSTRFTVDANANDENPVWSADGAQLAFASHDGPGLATVFVQSAARTGTRREIASGPENFHPIDWGRDGTLLLQGYGTAAGSEDIDLWILAPGFAGPPRPFLVEPGLQAQGQFSPDGRWVAYSSDESGRLQVYVTAFPSGEGRIQISSEGGGQPRWRGDGREIFYVSPGGTMMAVPIAAGDELAPGAPVPLFTEPSLATNNTLFFYGGAAAYDVSRDGRRFLVSRLTVQPSASPIHVVLNAAALREAGRR